MMLECSRVSFRFSHGKQEIFRIFGNFKKKLISALPGSHISHIDDALYQYRYF